MGATGLGRVWYVQVRLSMEERRQKRKRIEEYLLNAPWQGFTPFFSFNPHFMSKNRQAQKDYCSLESPN